MPNATDASECVEVHTTTIATSTTRKTWDAATRILTATPSSGGETGNTAKRRYRADGQLLALIEVEQTFQYDYVYDEHGNSIDVYMSYPTPPDVTMPSSAPASWGTTYTNEYDAQGRLLASVTAQYGANPINVPASHSTFSEDAQGRCSQIVSDQYGTRDFSYDDASRPVKVVKTGAAQGFCVDSTTTTSYDDAGRILQTTLECGGGNSGPNAGGTQVTTHTYHADGSETVDLVDGLVDVGDGRSSITRSAPCLAQDAAIGKPADARCYVGLML